jgi:hypothetical protein
MAIPERFSTGGYYCRLERQYVPLIVQVLMPLLQKNDEDGLSATSSHRSARNRTRWELGDICRGDHMIMYRNASTPATHFVSALSSAEGAVVVARRAVAYEAAKSQRMHSRPWHSMGCRRQLHAGNSRR